MDKPAWLKKRLLTSAETKETESVIAGFGLHTVCSSALCPNRSECFNRKVATFLILGNVCTRRCAFCGVAGGTPSAVDESEPERIAQAIARLGLEYAVITSVTRDDLPDKGAAVFAATLAAIRRKMPRARAEILTPDFGGRRELLKVVLAEGPLVFNHNLETVPRLYPTVRPQAFYQTSLGLLRAAKEEGAAFTKSGLMLGLGEEKEEVLEVLSGLRSVGCDILTLGQYLRPGERNLPVARYVTPEEFEDYKDVAERMGFKACASGPFVRSSYYAAGLFKQTGALR
ncbi:MAG: lipoyl synthase [Candidatus Ratteibacteria bacterium]|jgi:lipoic acid synthetase